ncbi:hypothetical protein ACFRCG_07305 [Embleya sp. NPDC056575]|uniref:hypothetical protein n=1 Tax=unclassified Embleya TaxID=2699296 RepID=UPI003673710D
MRRIGIILTTTLGAALLAAGTAAPTASAEAPRHDTSAHAGIAPARAAGCVNADRWPFVVTNNSSEPALVFDQPNCTGDVVGVVPPGQTQTFEFGQSAYFPQ